MVFKACNRVVIAELMEVSQPMEEPRRNASSGYTLHKSGAICTIIEIEHPELQFQVCDDGVDCQAKEEGGCQQALKSAANSNWEHPSILLVQRCQRLQKRGCICVGVSPDSTRLVKDVSAVSSFLPPNPTEILIRSLRCCGRGPRAKPLEKDCTAWAMSCSVTAKGGCRSFTRGGAGSIMSGWRAGCLAIRAAIVTSLCSATESSKQAKLTAPLKYPSSSFVETLVAK